MSRRRRSSRRARALRPRPSCHVLLAGPRGFCAGVDRAIKIVEEALKRHGAPVYVRHEIVHNRFVVEALERPGAVFVEELDEIPMTASRWSSPPMACRRRSRPRPLRRQCSSSTPPARWSARCTARPSATTPASRHILLIGHAGHPEVIGTMGQLPEGAITLVEDAEAARASSRPPGATLAYTTQTTLSVDDTAEIVAVLRERFPAIEGPAKEDICYATTNRQAAVKAIARAGRSW
jgi:4-hydroxy-3-methylbut-2-en-1-yl diphosphate reductase